ncbi:Hypothetical Protein FCC1311_108992 [Hondaea fermentalgiana]|uniref:Metallothionein n=1 Tax=Hondaea fermentalgiana TaxID=2315210 RepID=A0A2R5GV01_9STRA|nr:Hypothetical Protein FCC1311_108992 [Hondaea fermentalgiana]|eukprot:GBG34677.1 Hypothetical Protein FCC1311_108992 [Hondaea fermentalgiana]
MVQCCKGGKCTCPPGKCNCCGCGKKDCGCKSGNKCTCPPGKCNCSSGCCSTTESVQARVVDNLPILLMVLGAGVLVGYALGNSK